MNRKNDFIIYESAMARMERANTRLCTMAGVLILCLVGMGLYASRSTTKRGAIIMKHTNETREYG